MNDLKNTIFIGVVEDNDDPKKLGRAKIRVFSVYDDIPLSDLPWCKSWKDLNGNEFNVPDIGKVVSVIFDEGSIYKPEYIYAEHYNINLENKLKNLSGTNYTTAKSVLFDHSTQIYRTQSEGLKLDHEFSNINLDPNGNILLNLRDTESLITLGSADADEQSMLGTTFMNWMDGFIDNLLGEKGGPYIGNSGSPVIANPQMVKILRQYKTLRPKFISNHVKLPKNDHIIAIKREYISPDGSPGYKTNSQFFNSETGKLDLYQSAENPGLSRDEDGNVIVNTKSGNQNIKNLPAVPAPNDKKVGAQAYSESSVGISLQQRGKLNGQLDITDTSLLVTIGERGAKVKFYPDGLYRLHPAAAKAYLQLKNAAASDNVRWTLSSAYRSKEHQATLGSGSTVAKPGSSPHGFGGAIDIQELYREVGGSGNPAVNKSGKERNNLYKWMSVNGPKFGWYNPYRLADGTGTDEMWHWEYWGGL
jgi:hypothetical protein